MTGQREGWMKGTESFECRGYGEKEGRTEDGDRDEMGAGGRKERVELKMFSLVGWREVGLE